MSPETEKKKILIVDDEAGSLLILRSCLEKNGFEVTEGTNGQEALTLIKQSLPNLIIMDQMMPKMDGIKACALIKMDRRFNKIPLIMLTASADKADQKMSEQIGIDEFLNKPVNIEILMEKVRGLLSRG